ncbi:MAG: GNAT family N-acetyltransferase [Oscillospiraceae bacterium]|nr:GNAT family N-acetyltransferase [Oscillospiraceae bacterium]
MIFERYANTDAFAVDTLEILLEHEAQNMLLINHIMDKTWEIKDDLFTHINDKGWDKSESLIGFINLTFGDTDSFRATIKDDNGSVVLTAACMPPYDMAIYEIGNKPNGEALQLLVDELRDINYEFTSLTAERGLAQRFAEAYGLDYKKHTSKIIMQLDKTKDIPKAPGHCRPLQINDLHFAPYWGRACLEACHQKPLGVQLLYETYKQRIENQLQHIWEDDHPVSQVIHSGNTPNGTIISDVYTPPYYRGKGYATSLVWEVSRLILEKGKRFCLLYADAGNPISCGIYRKIGYYDLCVMDEIAVNAE